MNAVVRRRARAGQRDPDGDGPRDEQRDGDDRHGGPAVAEEAVERQQRAEHDEHAELDDLDEVVGARRERAGAGRGGGCRARSRTRTRRSARCPRAAGPSGRRPQRDAEREQRHLVVRDAASRGHQPAGDPAHGHAGDEAERHVLEHELATTMNSSSPTRSATEKASTAGSASPSLSPDSRFSEWRMTARHLRVRDDAEESTGSVGDEQRADAGSTRSSRGRSAGASPARRSPR